MTAMTLPTRVLIALVRFYRRVLSPVVNAFGPVCRFEPSCSRYALACLEAHGAARGSLLSIVRLCKCHPFHAGGYDPPPVASANGVKGMKGANAAALPPACGRTG
jgi:putative membrane protein insertion efficiency factor